MIHEKITKQRAGTTHQPCPCLIGKTDLISKRCRLPDESIRCIQSTGLPLHPTGKRKPKANPGSRALCGFYSKARTRSYCPDKSHGFVYGLVDQQSCKNGIGRVFIKTRPWSQKRDKLNFPAALTGLVSKSWPRFTVCLSRMLSPTCL